MSIGSFGDTIAAISTPLGMGGIGIVENHRTCAGRVIQKHVLYLGEINDSQREAWWRSIEILESEAATIQFLKDGYECALSYLALAKPDVELPALSGSSEEVNEVFNAG
jgi:hypothetical protein